jgi:amidase
MNGDDYQRHDGLGLAELIRNRAVSPGEVVDAAIARAEAVNPRLNAIIAPLYEQARQGSQAESSAPFYGVPFLLKDMTQALPGVPLSLGSRYFRDFVPDHHGELTSRYLRAGLVIIGKTNTPELGLLPTTEPELWGPTRNPWNTEHSAGGSSGGSAAAVAAGIVPFAHANDGGGSIRIPASCNGLFGLKPSRGRVPLGPDLAEGWAGLVCEHVVSRSVRDSAAALDATHGRDLGAPFDAPAPERPYLEEVGRDPARLRIAFSAEPMLAEGAPAGAADAIADAAGLLQDLGHEVVEEHPRGIDWALLREAFLTVVAAETASTVFGLQHLVGRPPRRHDFEQQTWFLAQIGRSLRADAYVTARAELYRIARQLAAWREPYDLVLTPTLNGPPPRLGELLPTPVERVQMAIMSRLPIRALWRHALREAARRNFNYAAFTPIDNVTGCPSMSVPLFWTGSGLPVGVMFTAPYGDEGTLFRLAGQLERARPWFDRRPPDQAGG